ncbi:hypothetical protein GCM10022260_25810 [Gaetbulibacter aestuarii]
MKKSRLYNSFSKQIEFIPEKSVEIQTDTILSNGFELHLKYTALDDQYKKFTLQTNPPKELNYLEFGSEVVCKKSGNIILNKRIDKSLFTNFKISESWDLAIMQYVWIDYESSLNEKVCLKTAFYFPETRSYRDFTIEIDDEGEMHIKQNSFVSKLS